MIFAFLLATVDHKGDSLEVYLNQISGGMEEKTELIEHVQKKPEGIFVDVGSGGDAIAFLATAMPQGSNSIFIAADIDPNILSMIPKRHPEIAHYIDSVSGPCVKLIPMSATSMTPLENDSVTGISASALAHEVFSYEPSKPALEQFLSEVCRTLDKQGVLVYRDPKWVDTPKETCILRIQSEIGKYYSTVFLAKFLDRDYSKIKNFEGQCCKPSLYDPAQITLRYFLKNSSETKESSFTAYLNVPCAEIDYTKDFSIIAPYGLIAEIQRHYLMYLRDYCPSGFSDIPEESEELVRLRAFFSGNFHIDPKKAVLLYQDKDDLGAEFLPPGLLEHLKREGEEHYFYKTTDELITYIGKYSRHILKNGPKSGFILAPIKNHIKESSRSFYKEILNRDMSVMNLSGEIKNAVTEKNIIHFQLQPEQEAFDMYRDLIKENPEKYPELKRWQDSSSLELLDLVDANDSVIGSMRREEIYEKKLQNFRVVNVFLINQKNELWIPIRNPEKVLFPLALDCSAGGHVLSGESYFEAFLRETKEELGIDPTEYPYQKIEKLSPQKNGTSAHMEIYVISYEDEPSFNKNDFTGGRWIHPKDLKELLKNGASAKGDLRKMLEVCFPNE